jgi:16S rRNA C1402 (ribose-2'-O) methylase RsmI
LANSEPRGEYVLVLSAAEPPAEVTDEFLRAELSEEMEAGATQRDAAAAVSERHGVPRNRVKKLASY